MNCPHIQAVTTDDLQLRAAALRKGRCRSCDLRETLWVCLHCGHLGCGRYANAHAKAHFAKTRHALTLDIQALTCYCYLCDDFVTNDTPRGEVQLLRNALQLLAERDGTFDAAQVPEVAETPATPHRVPMSLSIGASPLAGALPPPLPGRCGLRNLGNTCFANAVLQALAHTEVLREFLLGHRIYSPASESPASSVESTVALPKTKRSRRGADAAPEAAPEPLLDDGVLLSAELQHLVRDMWSGASTISSPDAFLAAVWRLMPAFRGYQQQDAQEFLRYLLDRLHTEMAHVHVVASKDCPPSPLADKPASPVPEMRMTRRRARLGAAANGLDRAGRAKRPPPDAVAVQHNVVDRFRGHLLSEVTCKRCQQTSRKEEPFLDLSLSFPEKYAIRQTARGAARGRPASQVPLLGLFDLYTEAETLDERERYACGVCQSMQAGVKRLQLSQLPELLCLHFKRFHNFGRSKIDTRVQFPLEGLDLTPYQSGGGGGGSGSGVGGGLYSLYAVVQHHGRGLGGGHYTAYARAGGLGQPWFHFNDGTVSPVDEEVVAGAEAYLLFYGRA